MSKINELNITISKALVEEVHLTLKEDGLVIYVSGGMYTKQGKKVSSFAFSSDWYSDSKIEIPPAIHPHVREIFEQLTPIIYEKLNGVYKALPAKKEKLIF